MTRQFSFGKKEKLKSSKRINDLFANGKNFSISPLRVSYQLVPSEEESIVQTGVSASKRHFKKAVDRNRIKRLMREAYRLQKKDLIELVKEKEKKLFLFFIYTGKTIPDFTCIRESMYECLVRLQKKIKEME